MLLFERGRDVLTFDTPENVFLIEPYLPIQSIVLLYGMPTVGKTPLGWAMAHAVQSGGKFLGIQAQQGNALVVELDMPLPLVKDRWAHANPAFEPDFGLAFLSNNLDSRQLISKLADDQHRAVRAGFQEYNEKMVPKLVVVDALREVIRGDINSPGVADDVYRAWHSIFPEATIVFIHHETKSNPVMAAEPIQRANGSMEFMNHAQVGLFLGKTNKGVQLLVTKTQASAKPDAKTIRIRDGVYFN